MLGLLSCSRQLEPIKDINNNEGMIKTYRFSLSNHQYIEFHSHEMKWGVHDPDCPCYNTKLEK